MAFKTIAALIDEPTSWPVGASALADFEEITSTTDSTTNVIPMPHNLAAADHYQVALIPMPSLKGRVETHSPAFADLRSMVVLPLTWKDLLARLQSPSAATKTRQNSEVIIFGSVSVKLSSMEVHRSGIPVVLTPLEFKLLRYLVLNPRRVIARDELLNEVWGFDNYPCTRTVDTHMWRLRQKLESDSSHPAHFHTVHAMGYKFLP